MTTTRIDIPAADPATGPDTMSTSAYIGAGTAHETGVLQRVLMALYTDRRANVSRPKLLFTVTAFDIAAVLATCVLARIVTGATAASWPAHFATALVVAFGLVTMLHANWSYTIPSLRRVPTQTMKIVRATVMIVCVLAGASFLAGYALFTPAFALVWMVGLILALVACRIAAAGVVTALSRAGMLVRRTLIVGGGPEAETLIDTLKKEQAHAIEILGVFDDRQDERSADTFAGYPKLGNFDQLTAFCRNAGVDLLVVTVPMRAEDRLLQILQRLFTIPVDIRVSAQSSKLRLASKAYSYIGSVPMLAIMDRPLSDWDRAIKNLEDRILGAILLAMAAPVMALCALAIRLDSKGPILFKQRRYGFNNELIEVYKFRSMYTEMTDANANKLATRDDPRITPVGRFLRRSSLDELPQLINVVKGEMSIVGPRPHATGAKAADDLYQAVVDGYFARHRMKPGVTGWAQVNGWRGETDTHEKIQKRVEHDLYYIDNWSVLFDLYIVALTPISLLTGKNAY
ncbi:MAG: undecaprenyl-phosphate glucose phosphotransferase [Hyphomicrobiaceae bacterium]